MSSFLQKHTRQPKLYIDLPSNGRYYGPGVLVDDSPTNLPVFGMTATDEMTLKTPDALFAGQATVDIIQNCIPNIRDPWKMPTIDVDHCLIAIRMATYGTTLPLTTTCRHCEHEQDVDLNLQILLDQAGSKQFKTEVTIGELSFNLKPLSYKEQSDLQKRLYETQRQITSIPSDWPEDKKNETARKILEQSTALQIETVLKFVSKIYDSNGEETTDEAQIADFLKTGDAIYYNKLKDIVEASRKEWDAKELDKVCDNEECGKTFKFSVTLDYSNFFAPRY